MSYAYDPQGRRTQKMVNGVATDFLHDPGSGAGASSEIAEYDNSGALLRYYVPGPAIDETIAMVTNTGTRTFVHADKLGSVIATSDTSGNLVEGPYTYDGYGTCFAGGTPCGAGIPRRERWR